MRFGECGAVKNRSGGLRHPACARWAPRVPRPSRWSGAGWRGCAWAFGPPRPLRGGFSPRGRRFGGLRLGECGGLRLGFDFCALRALWGPLRAPLSLNYVKFLLTMSRLFLAQFSQFSPACLSQFFAQTPLPLRLGSSSPPFQLPVNSRFGTYRKKTYLCPQLAVPASGYPCSLRVHEVVYRP